MSNTIPDLTNEIDIDDMPVCPLCGQPLDCFDRHVRIHAHGYMAMAHVSCLAWREDNENN